MSTPIVRKLMTIQVIGRYEQPKKKIKIGDKKEKVVVSDIVLVSNATRDVRYDSDEASLVLAIPPGIEELPSIREINKLGDGWWKASKIIRRKKGTDKTLLTVKLEYINVNRNYIEDS